MSEKNIGMIEIGEEAGDRRTKVNPEVRKGIFEKAKI